MTLHEFEIEFKEKCRLESVIIRKFEYVASEKLLNIELKYTFDSMPIPSKIDVERICFSDNIVIGKIAIKDLETVIKTFYT